MPTTMKAAIHLGEDYNENLVAYRNTNFDALKTWFDIGQTLILNQKHEILNSSTVEWQFTPWMRSTVPHDKVIMLSKANVTCLSRLSSLCGKDARTSGGQGEVERSTSIFPGVQ